MLLLQELETDLMFILHCSIVDFKIYIGVSDNN